MAHLEASDMNLHETRSKVSVTSNSTSFPKIAFRSRLLFLHPPNHHYYWTTFVDNMARTCTSLALRVLLLLTAVYGAITNHNGAHDGPSALLKKSQGISVSPITGKQELYGTLIDSQSVPSGIRRLLLSDFAIYKFPLILYMILVGNLVNA